MLTLENHVAVVTGASQGIGRALAIGLAAKGVRLFLVGRNLTSLYEVAEFARKSSPTVVVYPASVKTFLRA